MTPRTRSGEPERTPDGRYLVVDGRRWRATDPAIPAERRDELTRNLMAWRREVGRTRGTGWWEQCDDERRERWSADLDTPPQH